MSVYVDKAENAYGRMVMCHMMGDTTEELLTMAAKIDVAARWLQKPGTSREHFDVCLAKRRLALANGALEINGREMIALMNRKCR